MVKCKVNPRRELLYPAIVVAENGNVWLVSSECSGTLLKAHKRETRQVGYHSNCLRNVLDGQLLQGSITLSNE